MKNWLKLLRPHQYVKNGFVLVGLLFFPGRTLPLAIGALILFISFCAAASTVYVFNDICDLEADRSHPVKCKRPIASGAVSQRSAVVVAVGLAALALALALYVSPAALACVALYYVVNIAYSLGLKHVVILDVFLISAGFILRILDGTWGLNIPPSQWLLLSGLMLTLFLGFAKRRAELLMLENTGQATRAQVRKVLDDYSPVVLDQLTGVTAASTIISYSLYTVSAETMKIHHTNGLFYTVPFVMYGMFRYLFLLHHHSRGNDTAKDLAMDWHMIGAGLGWAITTIAILA